MAELRVATITFLLTSQTKPTTVTACTRKETETMYLKSTKIKNTTCTWIGDGGIKQRINQHFDKKKQQ